MQEPDGFLFFLPRLSCELKCVGLQPLPSPGAEERGPCPHPCYILAMSLQCSFLGVWVLLESSDMVNKAPFLLLQVPCELSGGICCLHRCTFHLSASLLKGF